MDRIILIPLIFYAYYQTHSFYFQTKKYVITERLQTSYSELKWGPHLSSGYVVWMRFFLRYRAAR